MLNMTEFDKAYKTEFDTLNLTESDMLNMTEFDKLFKVHPTEKDMDKGDEEEKAVDTDLSFGWAGATFTYFPDFSPVWLGCEELAWMRDMSDAAVALDSFLDFVYDEDPEYYHDPDFGLDLAQLRVALHDSPVHGALSPVSHESTLADL